MKKVLRKLMPTIFLLLVAAFMMGTSTFAWFTKNTVVTAKGMKIKLDASDNLLVAPDVADVTSNYESTFKESFTITSAATKLAPVSSVDGRKFFYAAPDNATAAGNTIIERDYLAYSAAAFSTAYNGALGFAEYRFQLKAMNGTAALGDVDLRLTKLDLNYVGEDTAQAGKAKAFRIAVFVEPRFSEYPENSDPNVTSFTAANAAEVPLSESLDTLKVIYAPFGAENFTDGKAVSAKDELTAVTKLNAVSSKAASAEDRRFDVVEKTTVKYYKVSVRLWLEGEDATCNNESFVLLNDDWELTMAFSMTSVSGGASDNVDNLGVWNNSKITMIGGTLKAELVNHKTEASYRWYKDGGLIANSDSPTLTPTGAGKYYCVIKAYDDTYYTTNEFVVE